MNWIAATLSWYLYLLVIGIAFIPLTRLLFRSFIDQGYPFAKTLGILLMSYLIFILGTIKLVPFTQTALIAILILSAAAGYFLLHSIRSKRNQPPRSILLIILEEALFIIALFFLAYVRGQEPSIRGLEKFMDFGFINSILRSRFFPPIDMWLSADPQNPGGYPINYYYFGHLTGAVLIKFTGASADIGYNLILATIFAQGITLAFSLVGNLIYHLQIAIKKTAVKLGQVIVYGLLGSLIINLGGNLHTIYLFTSGYSPDQPVPFWQILSGFNPTKYWYPNATRFIPFTIHEFPSYSYVVADLHGHVFDIPFVLLTLSVLLTVIINWRKNDKVGQNQKFLTANHYLHLLTPIFLGFLAAVHYMTNAFDGPIYILLSLAIFLILFGLTFDFLIQVLILIGAFLIFSFPFSIHFTPFIFGIGVNCSPSFLVNLQKLGPFLFEKGNCQSDPLWMLFILWGFFWTCFALFIVTIIKKVNHTFADSRLNLFVLIIFAFGTFLIIIPEFFYIKDIYPAHFRANTMFKLGYQAFIMMGVASTVTLYQLRKLKTWSGLAGRLVFLIVFCLVIIYPFFSFPAYYGALDKIPQLNGADWLNKAYPDDKAIVDYLNANIKGQPVILEAQGDSYTDYERISAYTGLPTVAGWWVHEWLWRGSANVVGFRIPDITAIYESPDLAETQKLLEKYHVRYVIISEMEKTKYKKINPDKFLKLGEKIFSTKNQLAAIYKINL